MGRSQERVCFAVGNGPSCQLLTSPRTKAELLLGTGAHHRLGAASANTPTVHQGLCAGARLFLSSEKKLLTLHCRFVFSSKHFPEAFLRPLWCKPDKIFFCTAFPTDCQMASAFSLLGLAAQLLLDALTCLQSRTKQELSHLGAGAQIFVQKVLSTFSTCSHCS